MAQNFFPQFQTLGVDLNNQSSTALFALGSHVFGTGNSEWIYVQANTSIVGNMVVAFNAAFTCALASGGDLTNGSQIAVAQTSISSQAFGWVAVRGDGLNAAITGTASLGVGPLFLAASSTATGGSVAATGVLSPVTTVSNTLAGLVLAVTSSGSLATVNLTWPRGFPQGA